MPARRPPSHEQGKEGRIPDLDGAAKVRGGCDNNVRRAALAWRVPSGPFQLWPFLRAERDGLGYHVVWFDEPRNEDEDRAAFERMPEAFSFATTRD